MCFESDIPIRLKIKNPLVPDETEIKPKLEKVEEQSQRQRNKVTFFFITNALPHLPQYD